MTNIKKIHNAVFVSDRIITYKVAAALLGLDVKETKNVLENYVNNLQNKDEKVNVSYVVGGITLTGQHKIKIVTQNNYENVKSCFKTITIDQIYSLQKSSLSDWTPIFNVDDFIYDEKLPEVKIKQEPEKETEKENTNKSKNVNKKGTISSMFAQQNSTAQKKSVEQKSTKTIKKENVKNDKNTFTNFFTKNSNKENVEKINKVIVKEEVDDEDEEIFRVNKKRSRVLNDDEEEENPTKCAKVDILDDPMEEEPEKEYQSDEDMFGSPEKDEELMQTEESSEKDTENSVPQDTESIENTDAMYEDDDGYFVTERVSKKPIKQEPEKQLSKKETVILKKKQTEEKKIKKEVAQKLKNSTNQKSILNFFQKK